MKHNLEWMPNTLFDMAAVCEKNGCERPRDILIEAALMLHLYMANQEGNDQVGLGRTRVVRLEC